jgi:hypothetical protein
MDAARMIAILLLCVAVLAAAADATCSFASCVSPKSMRLSAARPVLDQDSEAPVLNLESSNKLVVQLRGGM